ncbi:MAG: response regulator transcription factor [Mangrovibacterium sp.]
MAKKILVAEDNKLILETICHKLVKDGYEVVKTMNGRECTEYISEHKDEIDLLITDLYMPFLNGHEVINTVREELGLKIPILVLSADGAEDSVLKAFELGADDYVIKPFSLSELTIRLKKMLR